MGPPHSFIAILPALAFLLLLLFAPSVNGAVTNTTFDDTSSAFTFTGSWTATSASNPCAGCSSKPDASQTFGGTWHDGNIRTGAPEGTGGSFTFTGSAVYIFGIDQAKSQPDVAFTLGNINSVHHYTGTERFVYNALFFSATGLAAGQTHTVSWVFNVDSSTGVGVQAALFDYAVVTSGTEDVVQPTTTTKITSTPTTATTTATVPKTQTTSSTPTVSTSTATSTVNPHALINQSSSSSSSSTSETASASQSFFSSIAQAGAASSPTETDNPSGALTTSAGTPQSAASSQHSNTGAIVGAVLGTLVLLILGLIVFVLCRRRAQRRRAREDEERREAGLPPAPRRMRRIRGNNVLQPFVDDRPPDILHRGNVFAQGTFATASSAAGAGATITTSTSTRTPRGPPVFDIRAGGAGSAADASAADASVGALVGPSTGTVLAAQLPPAFVGTAATLGRYPPDKPLVDISYTNPHSQTGVARQPSQSTQSDVSRIDTMMSPSDKPERERETMIMSPSSAYPSERERYLEQRLATLEAHVASYLPPPYEQPEP